MTLPDEVNTPDNELRQKLAAIEHQRWADWQKWLHGRMQDKGTHYGLERSDYDHWQRQINTPYEELNDIEKLSDLQQVDRYWDLLLAWRKESLLALIGKDAEVPEDIWAEPRPEKVRAQNELRAELRKSIEDSRL